MAATTEPTVEAHSAGNATSASKKKKSKKVVADNSKYVGAEAVMPVQIKSSHAKGRHAVASKHLPAGTLVSLEKATGAIVRNTTFVSLCHHCFGPVQMITQTRPKLDAEGKEVSGQREKVTMPKFSCTTCRMAAYCSQACQKQHKREHDIQCKALSQANRISTANQVNLEVVRSVLALLARRVVDEESKNEDIVFATETKGLKATPFACVNDLNANRHYIDRNSIKTLQAALKETLSFVPDEAKIPLSEAVDLACRFDSNKHYFSMANGQVAGLFPYSALYFGHSCSPNCVFIGEHDGVLKIRTLSDVSAGQDLTVSYVELFQPREQRRRELLLSRYFWCKCKRCSTLLSQSVDRFMDGIQCQECKKGVMIFEETKEVQDINELMTDISALDQEIQGKYAECETCPAKIEVTKLVDILKSAITSYGNAHMSLQAGNAAEARVVLEKFIHDYEDTHILHPFNSYLINAYAMLVKTCVQLDEPDRAIRYNSILIDRMTAAEGAAPENYPRLADLHMTFGDLCLSQAKKKASNKTPVGRSMTKRYFKDAKYSLEQAYKARVVIYGENSQRAKETKKLLNDAKKNSDNFHKSLEKKGKKKGQQKRQQQQQQQASANASANASSSESVASVAAPAPAPAAASATASSQ